MARKILVAYDFTDTADRALAWAVELLRDSPGSLTLLHVALLPTPTVSPEIVVPALTTPSAEEISAYQARLREVVSRSKVLDASVEVVVAPAAGPVIVDRAKALGANLIVMGTHGRRPLARALLGSVADHVVRHAPCAVVTLRDGADG